jgi:hypothetical protein
MTKENARSSKEFVLLRVRQPHFLASAGTFYFFVNIKRILLLSWISYSNSEKWSHNFFTIFFKSFISSSLGIL